MSAPADRAAELRGLIDAANHAYYVLDQPDGRGRRLRRLDARARGARDGAPRAGDARLAHPARGRGAVAALRPRRAPAPHARLANARGAEELTAWHDRARRVMEQEGMASREIHFVVEPKIDGLAISLVYEDGVLRARRHPRRRRRGRGRDRQPAHDPRHPHPAAAAGRRRAAARGGGARRGVPAARGLRGAQRGRAPPPACRRSPTRATPPPAACARWTRRPPPSGRCRSGATRSATSRGVETVPPVGGPGLAARRGVPREPATSRSWTTLEAVAGACAALGGAPRRARLRHRRRRRQGRRARRAGAPRRRRPRARAGRSPTSSRRRGDHDAATTSGQRRPHRRADAVRRAGAGGRSAA